MNYLGIDLWDKRCWLAYSSEWFIFTLPWVARVEIVSAIKKIIKDKNIQSIVLWMPFDLYGKNLKQMEKTKHFSQKLKEIFPEMDIIEIDERFTTFQSLSILKESGNKDIANQKDSMSAYLILETFLNKK